MAKGTAICEAWKDFAQFVKDAGEKPEPEAQFRRRDFSKPFGPDNAYWRKTDCSFQTLEEKAAYMRKWHAANPEKAREASLKQLYGATIEWFEKQSAKQEGKCAICNQPETMKIRGKTVRLAVDHDHNSGKIRGLLCTACNRAIGLLKHDEDLLQAAIRYLKN